VWSTVIARTWAVRIVRSRNKRGWDKNRKEACTSLIIVSSFSLGVTLIIPFRFRIYFQKCFGWVHKLLSAVSNRSKICALTLLLTSLW
jgi:hypothetical protein